MRSLALASQAPYGSPIVETKPDWPVGVGITGDLKSYNRLNLSSPMDRLIKSPNLVYNYINTMITSQKT